MNTTTSYAESPERRQDSRRTFHPAIGITPRSPHERSTYNTEFFLNSLADIEMGPALLERRIYSDRRITHTRDRRSLSALCRRLVWVVGITVISVAGLKLLLSRPWVRMAEAQLTSYTPAGAQYQWLGFHRVPPVSYLQSTHSQSVFPT
jgi:hypothetical protein